MLIEVTKNENTGKYEVETNVAVTGGSAAVYFCNGIDNERSEGIQVAFSKKGSEYSIGETVTTTIIYPNNHSLSLSVVNGTIQDVDSEKKFVAGNFEAFLPGDEDLPITIG